MRPYRQVQSVSSVGHLAMGNSPTDEIPNGYKTYRLGFQSNIFDAQIHGWPCCAGDLVGVKKLHLLLHSAVGAFQCQDKSSRIWATTLKVKAVLLARGAVCGLDKNTNTSAFGAYRHFKLPRPVLLRHTSKAPFSLMVPSSGAAREG